MLGPIVIVLAIVLAILWIVGEGTNRPWLRRLAGPLFAACACGIAVVATSITTWIDDSIRYSTAVKQFVTRVVETADREGNAAAVQQLRHFDAEAYETYEGGLLLKWLAESSDAKRVR